MFKVILHSLLLIYSVNAILITQRRDKPIIITETSYENLVHEFISEDHPEFNFNITANTACAIEPIGTWRACNKNGAVWRLLIEIPNLNNDVDIFNAYWTTWKQKVENRESTYSAKDSMESIRILGSIESRENITEIKHISSSNGKVVLGCGAEGLDLRAIHTYDIPDNRLAEYKMRPQVQIKKDGVVILQDDIYARYRRSEAPNRDLVDCNEPVSATPIMEDVDLSCLNSIVIGSNAKFDDKLADVPDNRTFKYGLNLPYTDSPYIPPEELDYDLDTNMVTFVHPDYQTVHFPFPPGQYYTFLKKLIEYISMFKKAKLVKGPVIDLTPYRNQEVAFLAQRQLNGLNTRVMTIADSGYGCVIRVVAGSITVASDAGESYLWVPERGIPTANHGSNYYYFFYDRKPTYLNPVLDGLEFKFYPETNYGTSILNEDNIVLDPTCSTRTYKRMIYRHKFYDVVKQILPLGSKRHEDYRMVSYTSVFSSITDQNTCGTKQRANRCGSVNPDTGKVYSTIEFEVDDEPGEYTCYFVGVESKNSITLPLPPPPITEAPVVEVVTDAPTTPTPTTPTQTSNQEENKKEVITKNMETDYELKEFMKNMNLTNITYKAIPALKSDVLVLIIGVGVGAGIGFLLFVALIVFVRIRIRGRENAVL